MTLPGRVQRAVRAYMDVERANTVAVARRRGVYDQPGWLAVAGAGPSGVRLVGQARRRLPLHEITPRDRWRLLEVDDAGRPVEPVALWLGENGRPVRPPAWQRVCGRANQRAATAGVRADVHPHMLRHTFAVHMLGLLVQRVVSVALPAGLAGIAPDTALYTRVITDPLRQLQRAVGPCHYPVHRGVPALFGSRPADRRRGVGRPGRVVAHRRVRGRRVSRRRGRPAAFGTEEQVPVATSRVRPFPLRFTHVDERGDRLTVALTDSPLPHLARCSSALSLGMPSSDGTARSYGSMAGRATAARRFLAVLADAGVGECPPEALGPDLMTASN